MPRRKSRARAPVKPAPTPAKVDFDDMLTTSSSVKLEDIDDVIDMMAEKQEATGAFEEESSASDSLIKLEKPATTAASSAVAAETSVPQQPAPLQPRPVTEIFAGSTGIMPPLDIQANYALLHREIAEAADTDNAPAAGQPGKHIPDMTARIIREDARRYSSQSLPRVLASSETPFESTFLARLVTSASAEAGVPPHMNDPTNEYLMRMRNALRPSRRHHEERMLRPPRTHEPACSMGTACKGNLIICDGGGATLMAFYYEDEWATYTAAVDTGNANARLPENSRLCLLCLRYDTNRFLVSARLRNVQYDVPNSLSGTDTPPPLVQPHYNLVDVDGEYCLEDCNTSTTYAFQGVLYPIVKPSLTQFERVDDPETGSYRFRQTFPYPSNATSTFAHTDTAAQLGF